MNDNYTKTMTRSEFFKKLGIGAIICAMAPKVLDGKPKIKCFYKNKELEFVENIALDLEKIKRLHELTLRDKALPVWHDRIGSNYRNSPDGSYMMRFEKRRSGKPKFYELP